MKTAAEFFKEKYGHSYITPFDSISTIQFATDYALDILPSQPEVSEGRIEEIWEKHKSYFPSNCQGMTLGGFKKALISLQPAVSEGEKLRTVLRQAIRELRIYTIRRPSMKTDIIIDKLWEQYKKLTTKQ